MRILFIIYQTSFKGRGCGDNFAINLAKAAQRAGHSVQLMVCMRNEQFLIGRFSSELPQARRTVDEGVPIILLPLASILENDRNEVTVNEPLERQLSLWMHRQKIDLVHIFHPMFTTLAVRAAQRCFLPCIVSLIDFLPICPRENMIDLDGHLCPGSEGGERCGRHCLHSPLTVENLKKRVSLVQGWLAGTKFRVCPSSYAAEQYRNTFPLLDFLVIPRGLDLCFFVRPPTVVAVAEHTDLTLGYIGDFAQDQGLATLLRAVSAVAAPHLRLLVICSLPKDAVHHADVNQLLQADTRVQLIKAESPEEIARLLHSLDLVCLPSLTPDACSLILDQAAAVGVPALVSDLGASAERVAKFKCGLVLPAGNSEAWAKAIGKIVAQPELLAAWRANLPLPLRIEEETFFYETLYRSCLQSA